jgi:hypothetical protein
VAFGLTACSSGPEPPERVRVACTIETGTPGWPTGNHFRFEAPGPGITLSPNQVVWCAKQGNDACADRLTVDRDAKTFHDEARPAADTAYAPRYAGSCDVEER